MTTESSIVLRARQRVLLYILKRGGKYRANISQLARDMNASNGNVNKYVNELKDKGYLKVVIKGDVEYFRVTLRGQLSLYPILLPRLLTYLIMIIALTMIIWSEFPLLLGRWILSPYVLLFMGLTLLVFSSVLLWAENKMDRYLLESHLFSDS
jgi:predicted transcriptional regulator